jgi:hypothetical protein
VITAWPVNGPTRVGHLRPENTGFALLVLLRIQKKTCTPLNSRLNSKDPFKKPAHGPKIRLRQSKSDIDSPDRWPIFMFKTTGRYSKILSSNEKFCISSS